MASLFDKVSKQMTAAGIAPRTGAARQWLLSNLQKMRIPGNRSNILNDANRVAPTAFIGRMYVYHYDPKLKDVLPVWDKYPLVIPMEMYSDGFLGLNLHYIHPKFRINLLDKLSETLSNDKFDEKTKFRLSYSFLKSASKIYEATPCIKRYLYNQVKSSFLQINADEWDIAALLPAENFSGASTSQVHADSRKKF